MNYEEETDMRFRHFSELTGVAMRSILCGLGVEAQQFSDRSFRILVALAALCSLDLAAQQFGPWSAPVNLGAVVNSAANDQHPTISKDDLSLIFVSNRPGGLGNFDLWVTQRDCADPIACPWQPPVNLSNLNTTFVEFAPNLTTDGHWLFFHSNRPAPDPSCGGNDDIWASHRSNRRDDFGWEPPIFLGCNINTAAAEDGPIFFEDETGQLTLFFARNLTPALPDGFDIYASTCAADLDTCNRQGLWNEGTLVPELSSPLRDTRTALRRRDGLEMIISSSRAGGLGGPDLWVSTRASTSDPWSVPDNLGAPINSTAVDSAPALSWDGTTMYYYSTRSGGLGGSDLYASTREKLAGQ
jgi:WD40 repeat protein